jgi:hypothetical protein
MTCGNEVTSAGRSVRHAAKDLPEENVVYYYIFFFFFFSLDCCIPVYTHAYNTRVYFRIFRFFIIIILFFFRPFFNGTYKQPTDTGFFFSFFAI